MMRKMTTLRFMVVGGVGCASSGLAGEGDVRFTCLAIMCEACRDSAGSQYRVRQW
jgi:hypothetical protein